MKAYYATAYGGPEVMRLGELPDPSPRGEQVLVEVKASSVNPVDWKVRAGEARLLTGRSFPKVYGTDLAGVVAALGPRARGVAIGDRVYGTTMVMLRAPGAHAERAVVKAGRLRRLPDGLSFTDAAALPVAALTAQNGLRLCGELGGKQVLVNGATGGVGHFAVQLARARGAEVTAVCSARNAERARALGASAVLDYRQQDFTRGAARYDVIFDAHAHLAFEDARRVLRPRGRLVSTLPGPRFIARALWQRVAGGPQLVMGNLRAKPEDYAELERLLASGAVRPIVEHTYPLAEAAQAYATLEGGGVVGKVVIVME